MLNFSVNTNVGAFVALQNLSQTNRNLEVTQNRINTGLKVASTKDDSGTYAIAQNLRADIGGLNAVKTSLDRAQSTLDVAISSTESISDVLVQMKEKATAASDEGLDAESRAALEDDFNALINQIKTFIDTAEFNGSNILKADVPGTPGTAGTPGNDGPDGIPGNADDVAAVPGTPAVLGTGDKISAMLDTDATLKLEVSNQDLHTLLNSVIGADADWGDGTDLDADAGVAKTSADAVVAGIAAINTVLSTLGSASRQISAQQTFVTKLSDSIETGIGNLVDADLAKESARLTALQTQQQLGLQALSIANQAPQSIMSLFRN